MLYFNIDVLGVSRLLVEEIEKFRLCSFTEKSQRYVLFDKDFVIPEEIKQADMADLFAATIKVQNDYYHQLYEQLRPYVFSKNKSLAENPANSPLLEGWAKEDARYVIALATETQLGMTINARNLELMLRRLAALPSAEAQEYSQKTVCGNKRHRTFPYPLYSSHGIRPIYKTKFAIKPDFRLFLYSKLSLLQSRELSKKLSDVQLTFFSPAADNQSCRRFAVFFIQFKLFSVLKPGRPNDSKRKKVLFKTAFENLQAHDAVLRELENVDLQFELIVSASCFAQLKRHRMATIIAQEYDPQLGVTIPPSVRAIGQQKKFMEIMRHTQNAYEQIKKKAPLAAAYVLTNAHRKRVLMKFNARELYHLARLRADAHAQWDIRELDGRDAQAGKKSYAPYAHDGLRQR